MMENLSLFILFFKEFSECPLHKLMDFTYIKYLERYNKNIDYTLGGIRFSGSAHQEKVFEDFNLKCLMKQQSCMWQVPFFGEVAEFGIQVFNFGFRHGIYPFGFPLEPGNADGREALPLGYAFHDTIHFYYMCSIVWKYPKTKLYRKIYFKILDRFMETLMKDADVLQQKRRHILFLIFFHEKINQEMIPMLINELKSEDINLLYIAYLRALYAKGKSGQYAATTSLFKLFKKNCDEGIKTSIKDREMQKILGFSEDLESLFEAFSTGQNPDKLVRQTLRKDTEFNEEIILEEFPFKKVMV